MIVVNTETIRSLAKEGKRMDLRGMTDYRSPITIELDVSWTAEGSARVTMGETVVIAGVKLAMEKPYADTSDEGGIMVNAELLPLSSAEYEPGPPGIKAVELARVIDRGIREAKAIDLKKLCIKAGEKAWFITVDIITINDAGNLFDVGGLAALAALRSARFPVVDEKGAIDYKHKTDVKIPMVKEPLPITVYKVNGQLMMDLSVAEEKAAEARLTVGCDAQGIISALQKGGLAPLSAQEVDRIIDMAVEKSVFLRDVLDKHVKK